MDNKDKAVLTELLRLAEIAKDQVAPDIANVSDAEYKLVCQFRKFVPALSRLLEAQAIPEGWMRDRKQVTELAEHLESIGWQPDSRGDPDCVDQGAAMAAEVIRRVLLPLLAAAPPASPGEGT